MLWVYNVCLGRVYKPKRCLGLVITMVVVMVYIYIYMYAGVEILEGSNVYAHTYFTYAWP